MGPLLAQTQPNRRFRPLQDLAVAASHRPFPFDALPARTAGSSVRFRRLAQLVDDVRAADQQRGRPLVAGCELVDHLLTQTVEQSRALKNRPDIHGHRMLTPSIDVRPRRRCADLKLTVGRAERQPTRLNDRTDRVAI